MGYPNYPNNRLIVNGVDLTTEFKMVLVDGYTLKPPSPKTYLVDIPGGNGKLDLTESLLGDTAFNNRTQEFIFYVINENDFEAVKTKVSNFLHGRAYDYKLTMDQDYTYHGRFTVSEYSHKKYAIGKVGCIKISIESEPFKHKDTQVYRANAVGGSTYLLESGRERVRPMIETDNLLKVIYDGKLVRLPQGTWTINDLLFKNGMNEVYLNSFDIRNLTWGDLVTNNTTWGEFKKKKLYEWYKSNGDGTLVNKRWVDLYEGTVNYTNIFYQDFVDQSSKSGDLHIESNGDGTITIYGEATGLDHNPEYTLTNFLDKIVLSEGQYTISGICNGYTNYIYLYVNGIAIDSNMKDKVFIADSYAKYNTFTVSAEDADKYYLEVYIKIAFNVGNIFQNEILKPMLETGLAAHPFIPGEKYGVSEAEIGTARQVWGDLANQTWADQLYKPEVVSNVKDIYIKYDWGDL